MTFSSSQSKEPWKLSSYGSFNDKERSMVLCESKCEKLIMYANTLMNLDLKRQDNHNKAQGLLIAFAGLYNSLFRNDDYCRTQTKEKIERIFNDILQLIEKDAFNSVSTAVKADIYRRAGMMDFVARVPRENIDHQSDNRLLDHIKQLARKGITAPIAIGEILSMYDHSSITPDADRYFYHDSIL